MIAIPFPKTFHDGLTDDTKIFVVEGPDGAGKSTLVRKMKENYLTNRIELRQVRCPDNRGDSRIRECIMGEMIAKHPMAQAFLFMADFLLAYESVIKPELVNPQVKFIYDRYLPSTCVYQNLDLDYVNTVFKLGYPEFTETFSAARYVYLHPSDMDAHKWRLNQKSGDEINHLDPTTDAEIKSQIDKYSAFSKRHAESNLLGSNHVEQFFV